MTHPVYDKRHGGPYDRGSADAYYGRPASPHYFLGDTHQSPLVAESEMTAEEICAYFAGYAMQEFLGERKNYG